MAAFLPPQLCHFLATHRDLSIDLDERPSADILGEPIVGMADTALEAYLAERASRLGRQLDYRIQLRNTEHVAMYVGAGIGISILSDATARTLHVDLAVVPLSDVWATRPLHLCAAISRH